MLNYVQQYCWLKCKGEDWSLVQEIRIRGSGEGWCRSVAFDPSAKEGKYRLLSGWDDKSIRLYNIKAKYDEKLDTENADYFDTPVHTFTGHEVTAGRVNSIFWEPNGNRFFSAVNTVRAFQVARCKPNEGFTRDGRCKLFVLNVGKARARSTAGATKYTDPKATPFFAIGETHRVSPFTVLGTSEPSAGTIADVEYDVAPKAGSTLPKGLFLKTSNGDIQVRFDASSKGKTYIAVVSAVDALGARVAMETITMTAGFRDTDPQNPSYEEKCKNGGIPNSEADADSFDGGYSCNCDAIPFKGATCQTALECPAVNQSLVGGQCKDFILNSNDTRKGTVGLTYTDPNAIAFWAVGSSYTIAPRTVLRSTQPSYGTVAEITYTVKSRTDGLPLPPGLFLRRSSGNILVHFTNDDAGKTFTCDIQLVDAGGARQVLESLRMSVKYRDADPSNPGFDAMGPHGKPCAHGGVPVDLDGDEFNKAYTCNCESTAYRGDNCETLKPQIKCETTQTRVGSQCKDFILEFNADVRPRHGTQYTDPSTQQHFAVGTTYQFAALHVLNTTRPSFGDLGNVVYEESVGTSGSLPLSFFLNNKHGDILVAFTNDDAGKTFTCDIQLVDAGGARQVLESLRMSVKYRDADPSNPGFDAMGPHGKPCAHGGVPVDTGDKFDGGYTCDCTEVQYAGDNCETADAATSCPRPDQTLVDNQCATFELVKADGRKVSGNMAYTDPVAAAGTFFAVGKAYTIAPRRVAEAATNPSVGSIAEITYAVSAAQSTKLPALLFLKADTGEILVDFEAGDANMAYTVITDLIDAGGARVQLENFTLNVRFRDTDLNNPSFNANGPAGKSCANGGVVEEFDSNEFNGDYTCNCALVPFEGSNCETPTTCTVTQSLGPDGKCTDFVLDNANATHVSTNRTQTDSAVYTDPATLYFTLNETYRIAPRGLLGSVRYSQGTRENVTYALNGPDDVLRGFFLNARTGELLGSFPEFGNKTDTKRFTVDLDAIDAGGARQTVESMDLQVRYKDRDVAEYGPKKNGVGQACVHGDVQDDDPFDEQFTCDCSSTNGVYTGATCSEAAPNDRRCLNNGTLVDAVPFDGLAECDCDAVPFEGENCEQDRALNAAKAAEKRRLEDEAAASNVKAEAAERDAAVANAKAQNNKVTTIITVVTLIVVAVLAVAGKRYHTYWLSIQPVDWDKEFARMIESGEITPESDEGKRLIPREISRRNLHMIEKVGQGQFGDVFKAMLDEQHSRGTPEYMVAAKTVKDAANHPEGAQELVGEAAVMMQVIGHPNLVSIIGVVTAGDPLVLVLQYCQHGSVLGYLKKAFAAGTGVGVQDKMVMASEIADGMSHLVKKQLIHRDLAARNVLLSTGKSRNSLGIVCKVADFGLSRGANNDENSDSNEDYYKSSSGVFPVRWTSPEAMETLKFSAASDVWSFGIVVVELYQDGETPYRGKPNPDVMTLTMSGGRHPQPDGCDDGVYAALLKCWDADPTARPSFRELTASFATFSAPKVERRASQIWGDVADKTEVEFEDAGNNYTGGFGFDDEDEGQGGAGDAGEEGGGGAGGAGADVNTVVEVPEQDWVGGTTSAYRGEPQSSIDSITVKKRKKKKKKKKKNGGVAANTPGSLKHSLGGAPEISPRDHSVPAVTKKKSGTDDDGSAATEPHKTPAIAETSFSANETFPARVVDGENEGAFTMILRPFGNAADLEDLEDSNEYISIES